MPFLKGVRARYWLGSVALASDRAAQAARPSGPGRWGWLLRGLAIVAGCLFVAVSLYRALRVGWLHFHSAGPLALENPVIAGIMLLKRGFNLYSPTVNRDVPFYIQMYPPAYYYLVAALPEWPGEPYRVGRLVSGSFMVAAAATLFAAARRRHHIPPVLVLIAFFLSVYAVATNTLLARQDPMALFFAAGSIAALLLGGRRRWAVSLSASMAVIALAAKQSYVAAPLAAVVYLAFTDRATLKLYASVFLALGLAFAAWAQLAWGSGFWWSTVGTLAADFRPEFYSWHTRRMLSQATYIVFAALVVAVFVRGLFDSGRRSMRAWFGDLPLVYLTMAGVVWAVTLPKDGASLNYFFEPTLAGLLFCQDRLSRMETRRLHYGWFPALSIAFCLALVADIARQPVPPAFTSPSTDLRHRQDLEVMLAELRSLPATERRVRRNAVFVHPTLRNNLPNAGSIPILSDDYLYSILMRDGRLDPGIFVDATIRQRFDVVVLPLERPARDLPGLGDEFFEALGAHYAEALESSHRYLVPRPPVAMEP
jgi:hypothetical protein